MTTISGIFAATGPITFAAPESARTRLNAAATSTRASEAAHYSDMSTIHRRVSELGRALEDAQAVFESLRTGSRSVGTGEAISASALDIDPSARTSTLDSTEEVNTVPTSYTPFGPSWTGASSSLATIGGTYDGAQGDDTLRFQITSRSQTIGGRKDIDIRISNNGGADLLEEITIPGHTPADTPFTLSNGLTISLGAGDALKNDEFYLDVSTSVDSEVDPDLVFNGVRNDNPNLEPGLPVTAGSFTVNGEEISVAADDTVNTVLDRINASAAGVTAIYDPSTELVSFERDDGGALDITLAGDTSGFLDSMKLSGATVVLGNDNGELDLAMQDVEALAATVAGSITINDVEIALDPSTDSLEDVMNAINASEADVTASFDKDSQKVTLASVSTSGRLTVEDGGTNFLTEVEIDPGTYQGRSANRMSKIMARKAQRALTAVVDAYEKLRTTELNNSGAQTTLDSVVSSLDSVMGTALEDSDELLEDAGLSIDLDAEATADLMDLTNTIFERALRSGDGAGIKGAMVGSILDNDDGLLGLMNTAVQDIETALRRSTGDVGVYLSTYA